MPRGSTAGHYLAQTRLQSILTESTCRPWMFLQQRCQIVSNTLNLMTVGGALWRGSEERGVLC
jgi:hypothetical protein